MATYVIGDIHGCFDELQQLLDLIKFDPATDKLWFTGDLVNGGSKSIETLIFIQQLGSSAICVLGNHDLTWLKLVLTTPLNTELNTLLNTQLYAPLTTPFTPLTTQLNTKAGDMLTLPKQQQDPLVNLLINPLINWLRTRPMVHYDPELDALLVHAGVAPQWDLDTTLRLGKEVADILAGDEVINFLNNMFGNFPNNWADDLIGWDRARCIVNYMTRIRFCKDNGELELTAKSKAADAPPGTKPWFTIPTRKTQKTNIAFGHWAALNGKTDMRNVFALDTGCVWGNKLTALRLEDKQLFSVNSMTNHPSRSF